MSYKCFPGASRPQVLVLAAITLIIIWTNILNAETKTKSAKFTSTVNAGVWTGIKLSNMNAGATLSVSGTSSDSLPLYLFANLDDENFLPVDDAVIAIPSEKDFEFDYTIPADGDYVLVLDNREGLQPVDYEIDASASMEVGE